ncbi:MAG: agmatinase family protein [Bdellovibrionales bacterium]|nr:agmatinase family protein [Bdellovibrionales bacterium]
MGTEIRYDPNAPADSSAGIFGLPFRYEDSKIIYLPVAWEATTSYGGGTVHGPESILNASSQLDLFDLDVKDPYLQGLHCLPLNPEIKHMNSEAKSLAEPIKESLGDVHNNSALQANLKRVNEFSAKLNQSVHDQVMRILKDQKIPGLIGGDHSIPIGAFEAASKVHGTFGILHFDAHSDTRNAYMGFTDSHASIMRNAANRIPDITKFVQVGIRDFCEEESEFTKSQGGRFEVFYDQKIMEAKLAGTPFSKITDEIIKNLPEKVWVSFDIDGLDPRFCPHTGTPVPGGLDYSEAIYILKTLARSGRKIIGFDVVEVAPPLNPDGSPLEPLQASDEWDANVGMRLIYKLSALSLATNGFAKWQG